MELIKKINEVIGEIESLEITEDFQLENANALAKKCNELIKEVKASHKDEIAYFHSKHKEAKAKEQEELKPLEKAKNVLKEAIGDYMKIVEQRQLELAKVQEEEKEIFGEIISVENTPKLGGTHIRKKWKAKIVDEDKVPVKIGNIVIRPVDMKVLNDFAKYYEGQAKVEGVEFFQDENVVIR
jgi:hypothetical protein